MTKNLVTVTMLVTVHLACSSNSSNGPRADSGPSYKHSCPNPPVKLPTPTELCPVLQTTYNSDYTSSTPITIKGKQADIIVGTKPTPDSIVPFYIYWHGFLGTPTLDIVAGALTPSFNSRVLEEGAVVVGLYGDATGSGGTIILQFDYGHLAAADELLACAIQQLNVDICRIHTSGFSMGGLMATQMSYLRSNYLASIVSYSGGFRSAAPADQNPANKLAAMLVYGGSSDVYPPFNFQNTTFNFFNDLKANGHFPVICNHDSGHDVPASIGAAAWQFLRDHPYGVDPEPYAGGLPPMFPSYCSLEIVQPTTTDAGSGSTDTGTATADTGSGPTDAETATADAGSRSTDAGSD
jgi:hypothetical protein